MTIPTVLHLTRKLALDLNVFTKPLPFLFRVSNLKIDGNSSPVAIGKEWKEYKELSLNLVVSFHPFADSFTSFKEQKNTFKSSYHIALQVSTCVVFNLKYTECDRIMQIE